MTTDFTPPPAPPQTNKLSIASLVSGLVAWGIGGLGSCATLLLFPPLALCTWFLFLGGSIAATITGHIGQNQIRERAGAETGHGLAATGIALGWSGLAFSLAPICLVPIIIIVLALLGPAIGNVFSGIVADI